MQSSNPNGALKSRREFVGRCAAAVLGVSMSDLRSLAFGQPKDKPARVAITLDLEMSRNFPAWETTHWDFEKGNLDAAAKEYTVEACRRVKERGGVVHCFCVARVLEQENVDWLKGIIESGHPVGSHTYDHVNVKATTPEQVQFRFQRSPWLLRGMTPQEAVRENIRLATAAIQSRLGIKPAGFRTPGGFQNGLADRPDIQQMLLDEGFTWVSSQYPAHANSKPGERPTRDVFDNIVAAQAKAQPYLYPSGLVEVPMNPISDIGAFRNGRWALEDFLEAIRRSVTWCIENRAVFDFLAHPSCLGVVDPQYRAIDLICDLVRQAGDRARLTDLSTIARSHAT